MESRLTDPAELLTALRREAERIEEDAEYSHKGHYFAAERWGHVRYWLGAPTALAAALASAFIFYSVPVVGTVGALIATLLATLMTFLDPAGRAAQHSAAGGAYLELRNQTRIFRDIELLDPGNPERLRERLLGFDATRNRLNQTCPKVPGGSYKRAKRAIEDGQTRHRVDHREGAS
jgi:hypothetical protein